MDGTQQLKWGWPQFAEITKKDGVLRLKSHLMIALMSVGANRDCLIFDTMDNISHDANLTIECLHRCMEFHQNKYGNLPRTLNLQMDNCTRENKNTYMFAYLAWLVERKVFDQINISFLPVGHTHFCCDQVASRLSVGIKHNTILTQQEFHDLLYLCFTPRPLVTSVRHVADMKELMNPHIDPTFKYSVVEVPHGMRRPLHFRIELCGDGQTPVIRTKMKADQVSWSRVDFRIFKRPDPVDPTRTLYTSGFSLDDMGQSIFKEIPVHQLDKIEKNLINCRPRVNARVHAQWDKDYQWLADPTPIDFHWSNGGKYLPETIGRAPREAESSSDEDEAMVVPHLRLKPASGLYHSYAAMARADPIDKIFLGSWVIVDCRDDDTTDFRYYIGNVCGIDMKNKEKIDIIR